MRQSQLRTLAARGVTLQGRIRFRGLDAYRGFGDKGESTIIFSGSVFGPSWVNIGHILDLQNFQYSIVDLGRPYFVAEDTLALREQLTALKFTWARSARDEVFLENEGFVYSGLQRKFDPRIVIGPIILLIATVAITIFGLEEPETPAEPEVVALNCAIDMAPSEFAAWIQQQYLTSDVSTTNQVVIQTEIGVIKLTVEQALGSTQLLSGTFECEDGRSRTLQFRTDSQSGAGFAELGPRLDP